MHQIPLRPKIMQYVGGISNFMDKSNPRIDANRPTTHPHLTCFFSLFVKRIVDRTGKTKYENTNKIPTIFTDDVTTAPKRT